MATAGRPGTNPSLTKKGMGIVDGWPVPPHPVVPDPIPLAGSLRELEPDMERDGELPEAEESPSSRRSTE